MSWKRRYGTTTARAALVSLLLAAACGNVTPSNDGGTTATAEQACSQFSQTFCDALATCAGFFVQVWYGDAATCQSRTKLSCMTDQSVPGINRTPANIVACADAAKKASCDDLIDNHLPAACDNTPGPTVNGGGCGSSLQCMSGHCEKGDNNCGTCAPRQTANGNCTVDEGCTPGLVCANQKCVAPKELGNDCDQNNPCRAKLYCDKNSRKCTARAGLGAACGSDGNVCDLVQAGVACNGFATAPTCQSVGVAKGGQPCGLVSGMLTVCVQLNECAGATLQQPGVCAGSAADGAQCNDSTHCVPPAKCVEGLCRLPSVASCPGT
jgi:hypothetical protein